MSTPYIGQICYFPYIRGAPQGWQVCDGSLLSIANYETLYQLLGTTYGGDGNSTFGVPDLRGRVPIGVSGGTYQLGAAQGVEQVTLNTQQLPPHNHAIQASTAAAGSTEPSGNVFASGQNVYAAPATPSPQPMAATAIGSTGQNLPHDNCAPTLPIVACIATEGVYPQQS